MLIVVDYSSCFGHFVNQPFFLVQNMSFTIIEAVLFWIVAFLYGLTCNEILFITNLFGLIDLMFMISYNDKLIDNFLEQGY